ncbi:fungal protein [Schizosaccharomyces japonicus yFS275]|uniref:Fungal protein n=1 Tax=Schizosaccharomyces japonicus (strain yFS275 / FY16936) TaxID=402676 RepID=B6JUS4_SCHJY|nr:fungal protein [Schizosaccharomyces japonicus yFS275]EEB05057.1 fungal protein [Schizosaccharomyces japonicus yFS275]
MTEPVPIEDQSVLEKLIGIRQQLSVLKHDRSRYIDKNDVFKIYHQLVEQMNVLQSIRKEQPERHNRVDFLLDDCLHLLSLFYLAIGRNNDLPAFFAQLSIVKRLMDCSMEGAAYTENDTKLVKERLDIIREAIEKESFKDDKDVVVVEYLKRKFEDCEAKYEQVVNKISILAPELVPVQTQLVSIKRQIASYAVRPASDPNTLERWVKQLKEIEAKHNEDGQFCGADGEPLAGQELCNGLLEECFSFIEDIKSKQGLSEEMKSSPKLQAIYERLDELLTKLKHLTLTHRWTLRETDLYLYKASLAEIDATRVDGQFVDENGIAPPGQRILLYLLRRCYAYIYQLMAASEPVSEALLPVHNQLQTVKRCLREVQRSGGIYSERDLYPYQMKLASLENLRVGGKFLASDDSVPEGQELVNSLLAQCHQLIEEIRDEMHQHDLEEHASVQH